MTLQPDQSLLHYRLGEKIGEGGMGVVWIATDTTLDRKVAIKVLPEVFSKDPERLSRFKREARFLASLNHTNIAAIYSLEEAEGVRFLAMEYVDGETLADQLARGPLPVKEVLTLSSQIARALEAAHNQSIIHRDLKPANIQVTPEGQVKVLDFGLAKALGVEGETKTASEQTTMTLATAEHAVMGTTPYMSPEQAIGKQLDKRSDIWAFGCVLYEMLTGQRPFQGETVAATVAAIHGQEPDWQRVSPNIPAQVHNLLRCCLQKNADLRLHDIADARIEIEAALGGQPSHTLTEQQEDREKSIAVLAFADMSPAHDQDYFCEGIAEELINGLGRINNLRVVSRTSAFQFKDSKFDIREIGRRLNVGTIVEGSVRKAGQTLRIAAQLTNVADGYHLWSERYDRTMEDIFAIQDEIAENIVRALEMTLTPDEQRAMHKVATEDVEAYDYYLRGRKYFYGYDRQNWEFAQQMFERAIKIDPGYALAYAGIADCWSCMFRYAQTTKEEIRLADQASRKALTLDPDLAQAHASRGFFVSMSEIEEEADEHFEAAIRLDPKLYEAYYFYAQHCVAKGDFTKAAQMYERAIEVRPEDYQARLLLPQVYRSLGHKDDVVFESLRRGLDAAEKILEFNPDNPRALYLGAGAFVQLGDREKGLEWVHRAVTMSPNEAGLLYNVACVYAVAGEKEKTLDYLERAVQEGFSHGRWLETDSDLDPIREDPRFQALLEKIARRV